MGWIVVDAGTGALINDAPQEPMPVVTEGQEAVRTVLGYPTRCRWDVQSRGFRDVDAPPDPAVLVPILQEEIRALRERVEALETAIP